MSVTERQQRILVAIDVLVDARVEDVMAAVDSLSDDEAELDFWVRDRIRIALGLLTAADDEVAFWTEALSMACPPELRGSR